MRQLLKGARLVDPSQGIDEHKDLLIEKGRVVDILKPGEKVGDAKVVELDGMLITPGLIDIHTHLREPGFEYKETIASGSEAAVFGGFTSIACMANTEPVNDNQAVTEYILERARAADFAHVHPIGAISKGLKGEELAEIAFLSEQGCVGFSDDGKPVMDANLMLRAIEYAKPYDRVVISHPEAANLSAGGLMNESPVSTELGLAGIPAAAEEAMVAREIILAGYTGGRVHLAHISTRGSVELVRSAKARGIRITCESCPHYFTLTEMAVKESSYHTSTKVNPPLRGEDDRKAIIEGLADGTIDCIASDHAPHNLASKEVEYAVASSGISGIETSLALALKLVKERKLKLGRLVELMSVNPAEVIGIEAGSLMPGMPADITVIDLDLRWTVAAKDFKSLGRNTPFEGMELAGRAIKVFVEGKLIKLD